MSEREVRRNETRRDESVDPQGAGDQLEPLRQSASELLNAGEAAIERALSANSRDFLQANRQRGGQ